MSKPITTQIIAQAREMRQQGKTVRQIAAELGVNYSTLTNHVKGYGKGKVSAIDRQQMLQMQQDGLSTYKIADKFGVSQASVCFNLKKAKKEPASSANNASSKVSDDRESASPVLTDDYNRLQEKCQVLSNALKLAHKGIIAQYEEMTSEQQQAFDLGQLCSEIEYRLKQGGIDPDV